MNGSSGQIKIERIKAITLASLVPTGTNVPKANSTTTTPNFQANGLAHANPDKKIQATTQTIN
jgi:hypothetical protein